MKFVTFLLISLTTTLHVECQVDMEEVEYAMKMCDQFRRYTKSFDVHFENITEKIEAEELFAHNCEMAAQQNQAFEMQLSSYVSSPNKYFGKRFEDVVKALTGAFKREMRALPHPFSAPKTFYPAAPKYKNWCYLHNEVRDQEDCGGCWAFATVAVLEALNYRVRGVRLFLSEQMLLDCDTTNGGCNGGWPSDALNFAKKIGVCSSEYAYKNIEGVCRMKSCARVLEGSSLLRVVEESLDGDEERLKRIVNAKGPVVVVMHINEHILGYGGGVYIDDLCPKDDVNHAVVICGYGEDDLYGPFWIVRNSWSQFWGEQGYIKIARGRNTCGIASTFAMYAEM